MQYFVMVFLCTSNFLWGFRVDLCFVIHYFVPFLFRNKIYKEDRASCLAFNYLPGVL